MIHAEFYPKNHKKGAFWSIISYFLLTMGASSVADIIRVHVSDKLIIKQFIGGDIIIEYAELRFIKSNEGRLLAIENASDRLNLAKLESPDEFIEAIEKNLAELGIQPEVIHL